MSTTILNSCSSLSLRCSPLAAPVPHSLVTIDIESVAFQPRNTDDSRQDQLIDLRALSLQA